MDVHTDKDKLFQTWS